MWQDNPCEDYHSRYIVPISFDFNVRNSFQISHYSIFKLTFCRMSVTSLVLYLAIPPNHVTYRSLLVNTERSVSIVLSSRIVLNLRRIIGDSYLSTDMLSVDPSGTIEWRRPDEDDLGPHNKVNYSGTTYTNTDITSITAGREEPRDEEAGKSTSEIFFEHPGDIEMRRSS